MAGMKMNSLERARPAMKIVYYEKDDILFIELSTGTMGEITILDAQKGGIYPLQIERVVADAV